MEILRFVGSSSVKLAFFLFPIFGFVSGILNELFNLFDKHADLSTIVLTLNVRSIFINLEI